MILADDNFATIVNAVREGRRIFDNIKKYLVFLLQCNLAEIAVMLVAVLAGLPLPLTAIQLLWVNLTTDGLPALALGVEPPEPDVMKRKPKPKTASIINRKEMLLYLVIIPATLTIILLSNFVWALQNESVVEASTQLLTVMITCELVIALSCHSLKHSIVRAKLFSNKLLWLSVAVSFALQLIVLYVPFMHESFDITYPSAQDWALAGLSALAIFAIVETAKWVFRNDST
jgi:Ca2+-transporting ATPase